MAKKKEVASKLLKALGKTKKEQMAKLYPKVKGDIRGKGPYLRGKVMGSGDFLKRREVLAGTKATKAPSATKLALRDIANVVGAGTVGYGYAKGWHKKLAGAVTDAVKKKDRPSHQDKARAAAEKGIKKQKAKKEKRKSHH